MTTLRARKSLQGGAKKTYDEVMDAWEDVPSGWWLKHHSIVFLLSLMVHRQSPAIINQAADGKPGQTRDDMRAASAAVVAQERRVESLTRHGTNAARKEKQKTLVDTALEDTYKAARVEGMKGVAIKHCITAAEMKLRMMNENRAYYVAAAEDAVSGEAELNKKIKSVIDNLPDSFEDLTGKEKNDNDE